MINEFNRGMGRNARPFSNSSQGMKFIFPRSCITRMKQLEGGGKIMKKLSCKDMGTDCGFVATGNTAEEVKKKMMEHANMAHKDMMAGMSGQKKEEMMKMMDEKMMDA